MNEVNVAYLKHILEDSLQDAIVIDVRDSEERVDGYIPLATHIPLEILVSKISYFLDEFSGKKLYFQCQSGRRSKKATTVFLQAGFKDVFSVKGGIKAWQEAGFDLNT
jgi:rhodanese-related sulfurtransferase